MVILLGDQEWQREVTGRGMADRIPDPCYENRAKCTSNVRVVLHAYFWYAGFCLDEFHPTWRCKSQTTSEVAEEVSDPSQ
jgi:hypothetical protein